MDARTGWSGGRLHVDAGTGGVVAGRTLGESLGGGGHDGTAPRVWVRVRRSVVAVSARVLRTGSGPDQWRDSGQGVHLGMGKKQAGASEPMPSTRTGPWSLRDPELTTLALKPQLWACDMPVKKKKKIWVQTSSAGVCPRSCVDSRVCGVQGGFWVRAGIQEWGQSWSAPWIPGPSHQGPRVLPGLWAGRPPETSPTSFHLLCPGFLWLRRA